MILVIDDFEPQRFLRKRLLEAAGFPVCAVGSVAAARDALAAEPIHVVVSDIGLGDGNGIALCAEIKRDRPALPVVLVTATYRTAEIRRDAMAAGADAILTEPLPADQLVRVVLDLGNAETAAPAGPSFEIWTDRFGVITDIPPSAARLLNISVRHCLGRKIHLFFAHDRPRVLAALERASRGAVETLDGTLRPREMRPVNVHVSLQPSGRPGSGIHWRLALLPGERLSSARGKHTN